MPEQKRPPRFDDVAALTHVPPKPAPVSPFAAVPERKGLTRVQPGDFPALPEVASTPVSTPRSTPEPEVSTPSRPETYPTVYPVGYPAGVPGLVDNGVPHETRRAHKIDTRAQLNLKISMEKLFQLKQFCESTGTSQREAIEEAIELLTGRGVDTRGRPERYPGGVDSVGSFPDLTDREILSIIDFYKAQTGNEWTPGDEAAMRQLQGRVPVELVSAGIVKAMIGSRGPVATFTYCAKTALDIATKIRHEDRQEYLKNLWRHYERNRESIVRKQRGL
jgi:hypothetical protein